MPVNFAFVGWDWPQYRVFFFLAGVVIIYFLAGGKLRELGVPFVWAYWLLSGAFGLFFTVSHYSGSNTDGAAATLVALMVVVTWKCHKLVFHGKRWRSKANQDRQDKDHRT